MSILYSLAYWALAIGLFLAASYVLVTVQGKTRREWVGWMVGLAVFFLLAAAFGPAFDALESAKCKGAPEYDNCMDGE